MGLLGIRMSPEYVRYVQAVDVGKAVAAGKVVFVMIRYSDIVTSQHRGMKLG